MTELENLKTAVENDDKAQALRIVPELVEEFEERRMVEYSRIELAKTVKNLVEREGEDTETASEYLKTTAEASEERTRLNASLYGYLSNEENPESVLGDVEDALSKRQEVISAGRELVRLKDEIVDFPPVVVLYGDNEIEVKKGERLDETYYIENIGGNDAENVSFSVESTELGFRVQPSDIGKLPVEEAMGVSLVSDIPPESRTGFRTTVSMETKVADSEEETKIPDSLSVTVEVTTKGDYLDRAISQTRNLRSSVLDTSSGSGNPGRGGGPPAGKGNQGSARGVNGLRSKLDNIEKTLVSIEEQMDVDGGPSQNALNSKIDSVINKYGAFLNQVKALGNSGKITEFRSVLLQQDGRGVVDTLENAKTAK